MSYVTVNSIYNVEQLPAVSPELTYCPVSNNALLSLTDPSTTTRHTPAHRSPAMKVQEAAEPT